MKNKGFTLIELLAVIVILAIIALIATPIIIGIINNAKEESDERSVELYASAIKNALANHQLLGNNPISGTGYTSDSLEAVLDVDYDGDVDCSLIDITTDGKVTMLGCKVNGGTKEYSYGKEERILGCTISKQNTNKYTVGDLVTCVLPGTTERFYVLEDAALNASSIKTLTEYNLTIPTNLSTESPVQSATNAGTTEFSSSIYWTTFSNEYIYGSNAASKVYPIVEGYVSYLNDKVLTGVTGNLLSVQQAQTLGCQAPTCGPETYAPFELENPAPEWLWATNYWLGSSSDGVNLEYIWVIEDWGLFYDMETTYNQKTGVRPVITIPTANLK